MQHFKVAVSLPHAAGYCDDVADPSSAWLWECSLDLCVTCELALICSRVTFGSTLQGPPCSPWATVWCIPITSKFWLGRAYLVLELQGHILLSTHPLTVLPIVLSRIRDLTEEQSTVCYPGTSRCLLGASFSDTTSLFWKLKIFQIFPSKTGCG